MTAGLLETPQGAVKVRLDVLAHEECGTVDWRIDFPDGSVGIAQSRAPDTTRSTCIYTFVLHAPPVALEQVEGMRAGVDRRGAGVQYRTFC